MILCTPVAPTGEETPHLRKLFFKPLLGPWVGADIGTTGRISMLFNPIGDGMRGTVPIGIRGGGIDGIDGIVSTGEAFTLLFMDPDGAWAIGMHGNLAEIRTSITIITNGAIKTRGTIASTGVHNDLCEVPPTAVKWPAITTDV